MAMSPENGVVHEKDQNMANLEVLLKEKEAEIGNLRGTISQRDVHIANLETTLNNIYNSHGWKALLIYYKVRDKIFPLNSKRRKVAKFVWSFINIKKPKTENEIRKTLENELNVSGEKNYHTEIEPPEIKTPEIEPPVQIDNLLFEENNYCHTVKELKGAELVEEYGFSGWEIASTFQRFRWMPKEAEAIFEVDPSSGTKALATICDFPFRHLAKPQLTIFANAQNLGTFESFSYNNRIVLPLPASSEIFSVKLKATHTTPSDPANAQRELGIRVFQLTIHSEVKAHLPRILELETSTYCNITPPCVMCYPRIFKDKSNTDRFFDDQVLEKLCPHLGTCDSISLHGVGEPLTGNALFKILDKIDPDKTYVQFNSNGLLLTEEKSNFIIEKKLKLINFSIDAASKEKYRNIRRSDFNLVINNIKTLSLLKKSKNGIYPSIMINMVLMKENVGESIAFLDLAKEVGAEYVYYSVLNQHEHEEYEVYNNDFRFKYKEQMLDFSSESFRNLTQDIKVKAEKMGLKPIIIIPEHRDSAIQKDCQVKTLNSFFCLLPWEHLVVNADGKCFFCCHLNQQEGLIGDLAYQSFEEVWHSQKAYEIRSSIAHGQMPVACSKCDVFGQVR